MIIWGWGKTTKKMIGGVMTRHCEYCNRTSVWQLCVIRTWFTLFFIPIIPYKKMYCVTCPGCGSYFELEKEKFEELKLAIELAKSAKESSRTDREEYEEPSMDTEKDVPESVKYAGKTETQIEYLKHMESINNKE